MSLIYQALPLKRSRKVSVNRSRQEKKTTNLNFSTFEFLRRPHFDRLSPRRV